MLRQPCNFCGKREKTNERQWWSLSDYHGITGGNVCPDCYEKVSHDSYGNPKNPEEYLFMLLKHGVK
jgi:hypothetical protein